MDKYRNFFWSDLFETLFPAPECFTDGCFVSFVHIFVSCCKNGDDYDDYERHKISKWLGFLKSIDDSPHYVIVHFASSDTTISVKNIFSRSIFERFQRDFCKSSNGACIKVANPAKKSKCFNELCEQLLTKHKINILNFISRNEANFLLYWGSVKSLSDWSIAHYFSNSYKLFVVYTQLEFVDDICELYSRIHSNLFNYIRMSTPLTLPRSLQAVFEDTRDLLIKIELDPDAYFQMSPEMAVPLNPSDSPFLKGTEDPKTLFSLMFQTIGANLYCSLWHKSYSNLFVELCEFSLEFRPFLKHINSKISDYMVNHFTLEICRWILKNLQEIINATQISNHYKNFETKPFFVSGLCQFLAILCQTLKCCLLTHSSTNLVSISQNKSLSIPDTQIDETLVRVPLRISVTKKSRHRGTLSMSKSGTTDDFDSTMYESQPDLSSCSMAPSNLHTFPYLKSKVCIQRILDFVRKLPFLKKNHQSTITFVTSSVSVFYNTSILLHQSHFSGLSTIFLFETARLCSLDNNNRKATHLYSCIMKNPGIYTWPNLWQSVLARQLESIIGLRIFSRTDLIPNILSKPQLTSNNVLDTLKNHVVDSSTYYHVVSVLLYLSTCTNNVTVPLDVCKVFFEYFLSFMGWKYPVCFHTGSIMSQIQIQPFLPHKLNSVTQNVASAKVVTNLPEPLKFTSIKLYFKSLRMSSLCKFDPKLSESQETGSEIYLVFEDNNITLHPGLNLIHLKNRECFVSHFVSDKIEFCVHNFTLYYHFQSGEKSHLRTHFSPPVFSLNKPFDIVPGFNHKIDLSVRNHFSGLEPAENLNMFVITDSDVTVEGSNTGNPPEMFVFEAKPMPIIPTINNENEREVNSSLETSAYELAFHNIPNEATFGLQLQYYMSFDYKTQFQSTTSDLPKSKYVSTLSIFLNVVS
ncbi:Trafficking protein particle complex subunit 10 [Thelohanellus kitauei]|uniref:Trafficking protein particle complex subunit 10 n=1 Tax=Thelohanellus kitauei TaxID=669202 RepID=A0A0C2JMS7_THEKT|nr:Trafficking protein particle complex subunit 10 [Thelohanellus kitauei]